MSQESQQYQQNLISGDLQDIIYSYQAHPELLKLILLSKLEEDKRRAEEAKLRAKELDLILLQQQDQYQHQQHQYDTTLNLSNENSNIPTLHGITSNNDNINTSFVQSTPPLSSSSSIDGRSIFQSRPSLDVLLTNNTSTSNTHVAYLTSQQQQWAFRRESVLCSSFKGSAAVPGEFVDRPFSPTTPSTVTTSTTNAVPTPVTATPTFTALNRPRRRREMQAITKIVETREYPYNDGYFWKNNGNTVQKKTGNKSVYYKCSNSTKGCPVNKTVTWKDNGEFLIKYRGEHLSDCNKVQRIVDI
ncbi:hypothetical protein BDF20DRAFT_903932 [Mycotypha africana]|uniref:uncharacterized protein n=1 Tax=Mycotypha africana TaxID=64632 RepID=UPI002301E3E9|nr:uncharacterized protein BDF20DRAFT_903932 [Mycotypha africana]KAI8991072.1 hypothetical protein BDF20DRAFT_903932 [Mycotypha africana]